MKMRKAMAVGATAITCAGLGAFAATGFGDDPTAGGEPLGTYETVDVKLEPDPAAAQTLARQRGAKKPKVTHLITVNPVPVAAQSQIVAVLKCKKSQGVPVSGGPISPANANIASSVTSRFNPNDFSTPARTFYVGVRNSGVQQGSFYATLACMKNINER